MFDPGVSEVRVVLDDRPLATARVEIDDGADGVLVEYGNGTVCVHAGLYERSASAPRVDPCEQPTADSHER